MITSNSELEIYTKCRRQFYYAIGLGIQPKDLPKPLATGIFGHELQEVIWDAIKKGHSLKEASDIMLQYAVESGTDPGITAIAIRPTMGFVHWAVEQGWEPISLENSTVYRMDNDLNFGMRPDAIFKFTKGIYKDQYFVIDFKYTAQYWNDAQVGTAQQIPKYIRFLNQHEGYNIRRGAFVFLNTRPNAEGSNLFQVRWVPISKTKLDRVAVENYRLANEVANFKSLPIAEMESQSTRTLNTMTCKLCAFADDLCPMDFMGHDTTKTMATFYEPNTYGYNEEEVVGK